MFLLYFSAENL